MVRVKFTGHGIDKVVEGSKGDKIIRLALENQVELPVGCRGLCQCGTCHVYIKKGGELLPKIQEEEREILDFSEGTRDNSRLACQCSLLENDGELEIEIPTHISKYVDQSSDDEDEE